MNHSPEPWRVENRDERDERNVHVVNCFGSCILETDWIPNEEERADYCRIVACVNFCRNFDTKFIAKRTAVNLRAQGIESLADLPGFDGLMAIVKNQG